MNGYDKYDFLLSAEFDSNSTVKVTKVFYGVIFLLFISPALIIRASIGIHEYYQLQNANKLSANELLILKTDLDQQKEKIAIQQERILEYTETISQQHSYIHEYSQELQVFQSKLEELLALEQQIRAGIRDLSLNEGLSGKGGGSSAEDMQAKYDMTLQLKLLDQAIAERKQSFENVQKYLNQQRRMLAATPSLCPVKGIKTSGFGYRLSPFTGNREFHRGLDVASPIGTPIRASADGRIITADNSQFLGNYMEIDHGNGIITRYGHIDRFVKKRGDRVKKGDIIARVGNTGRSTGPHLHYEITLNGTPVDPELYISKQEKKVKLR